MFIDQSTQTNMNLIKETLALKRLAIYKINKNISYVPVSPQGNVFKLLVLFDQHPKTLTHNIFSDTNSGGKKQQILKIKKLRLEIVCLINTLYLLSIVFISYYTI